MKKDLVVASGQATHRSIVMLTCQFSEILGGAEKQCRALTDTLRDMGINVVVVTSRVPGFSPPRCERGVLRFWTYAPPQLAGRHLPASILWAIQVLIWIWWNRRWIAVLHCHQLRINAYVAALANKVFGIPTVMKLGVGGDQNDFDVISRRKYCIGPAGARFVARRSSAVVATASQIARDSRGWGVPAERIFRIPNGVDLAAAGQVAIGESDRRADQFASVTRFAFLGRLSEEKNVRSLLKAAFALRPGHPAELHFIGDGPLRPELEAQAVANPASPAKIIFHGRVDDIFACLSKMHFLAMVSTSEGLSNALLEAASAGVVPILSDVSGNREVVPSRDFPLLLHATSAQAITVGMEAARSMSSTEWLRWSDRIARTTRANYGLTEVAANYVSLYSQLGWTCGRRRRPDSWNLSLPTNELKR